MITIESINERKTAIQEDIQKLRETISQLDAKRQELVNNLNALSGADQQCDHFLSQLEEQETTDEKLSPSKLEALHRQKILNILNTQNHS